MDSVREVRSKWTLNSLLFFFTPWTLPKTVHYESTNRNLDICKNQVKKSRYLPFYDEYTDNRTIEVFQKGQMLFRLPLFHRLISFWQENHKILNSYKLYSKLMANVNVTLGHSRIMFALKRCSFLASNLTYSIHSKTGIFLWGKCFNLIQHCLTENISGPF